MKEGSAALIEKARRSIEAAQVPLDHGDADFAASRAYYGMFYTAEALLHERGLRSNKHSGVHALFGEQFAKTGELDARFHRWLLDAFDKRIEGDYEIPGKVVPEEAEIVIGQAREFLTEAERLITEIL